MTPDSNQALPQKAAKLITCVLPDDGSDKALMRKLRQEKQIINTSSVACRGIAVLQRAQSKRDRLPVPHLVRMVEVAVAEEEADALFDYIYETAGIGHKRGGTIFMGPLINMTPFELPEGVPDEKAD
jgi:nitrogen regulatory protein PII